MRFLLRAALVFAALLPTLAPGQFLPSPNALPNPGLPAPQQGPTMLRSAPQPAGADTAAGPSRGDSRQRTQPESLREDEFRAPAPAEPSEFQNFVAQSVGQVLPVFGQNLFLRPPSTFAPVDRIPVTSDYQVGPGDEILLRGWGQIDADLRLEVDRLGNIFIPKVGNVHVAGLKFQDLHGYLKTAIGRVFQNFELNVSLGQLKSIQVFVVGQAKRPGAYTVSALSTLVNALFASGGPSLKGSMRQIQLKRGNQLVTEFDFYDLLLSGDKSKDVRLLPGDVIYIPPTGPQVAVSGSVNVPAIYELKGATPLQSLIALAGGLATTAAGQKVTLERIKDRKSRSVEEFSLSQAGRAQLLQDGDLVTVYALSPRFDNAVSLRGNVAQTMRFPWREGLRIRDIIPDKDSLLVPDYWVQRNQQGRPGNWIFPTPLNARPDNLSPWNINRPTELGPFSQVDGSFTGQAAPPGPSSRFFPETGRSQEFKSEGSANLLGGAGTSGQAKLQAAIKRSNSEINWDYAVVERLLPDLSTALLPFNLGKALEGDFQHNLPLQPSDVVTVFSKEDIQVPVAKQSKYVRLEGEFAAAGVYKVEPGETLRQLVARVGGLSPGAYLYGAEFTRESTRILQQKQLEEAVNRLELDIERTAGGRVAVSAEEASSLRNQLDAQRALVTRLRQAKATGRIVLELDPERLELKDIPDIALEDGDRFFVPNRPSTVAVIGSVYNENAFLFKPGKRLGDYLAQAGGPTRTADTGALFVLRADGSVHSKRQSGWFSVSGFDGARLMPGDTVVVPEDLKPLNLTKEIKDWTQILYQFALGAAAYQTLK